MNRILYFSAVGGGHVKHLIRGVHAAFRPYADFRLVQYDACDLSGLDGVDVIRERGHKWPLARRHLSPDRVADYDYIAVWDDDVDVGTFDLARFADLMSHNRLALTQPSIRSPHWISHPIVRQQPRRVGRFTNFVEFMVPVFSREGWRSVHPYLTDENTSGWGYDYLPVEPRGVVDCMSVVHTRPVSSCTATSRSQLGAFHRRHGLTQYATESFGDLRDPRSPVTARRDDPL